MDAAGSVDKMDEFMLPVTRACLKECWLASVFVVLQYSPQGWLCVMETSWQIWPLVASVRNPSILNSFCRSWIAGKSSMTNSCLVWVSGPLVLSFITSLQRTRLLSLFDWNPPPSAPLPREWFKSIIIVQNVSVFVYTFIASLFVYIRNVRVCFLILTFM